MDWLADVPPPFFVALAVSLALGVLNWRLMTGGQRIETPEPDGLGGRRAYSRAELSLLPPLFVCFGALLFVGLGHAPPDGMQIFAGVWTAGVLVFQGLMIAAALKSRRGRAKRRQDLFGE